MATAPALIDAWLTKHNKTRAWLADSLGVKRETLWRWLNGKRTPRIDHCVAIQKLTRVPASSWAASSDQKAA